MDTNAIYDEIGVDYIATRRPDPRIAAYLAPHVAGLTRLLNVGAGSGSYEPMNRDVVAIEPSWRMIKQRTVDSSPCVLGKSESLPFRRDSFDGSLALLTLHHWDSIAEGLQEMKRVSCKRVVILTWDPDATDRFWLTRDYLPEMLAFDLSRFPPIDQLAAAFDEVKAVVVQIPHDCTDGFLGAFWRRPAAYLDRDVQRGMSSFQQMDRNDLDRGMNRLRRDLDSGKWSERYGKLLEEDNLDIGYRLVVADP